MTSDSASPTGPVAGSRRGREVAKTRTLLVAAILAAAFVPALPAAAQSFDVTGVVVDTTGLALRGATVVAITESDSTLTSFGTTRADGDFQLRRVPTGRYVLQISFVGFRLHSAPFQVTSSNVHVGTITMEEAVTELGELVVTEERIPIVVHADTVVYDASAFSVRPNATVEELLKRLPGIEVGRDGTVTAQGEQVQKVLVDGKEFFGDDPKIATKNLPAEAVDRVQVYDRKSDIAEFTGVDDGEDEKTINLELKEDHRRGYFGNVSGAYGAENRYDGHANINRFTPSTQAAVIANASNVQREGFSSDGFRVFEFFGGDGRGGGSGGGLTTTASGGLNLTHDFTPRTSLRSSYFLNHSDQTRDRETFQQQLLGNTLGSITDETSSRDALNFNHRLNFDLEHEFSERQELRLRFRGQASDSDTRNTSASQTRDVNEELRNTSEASQVTVGDRIAGNARLTYMYRFGETRRSIVAEVRGDVDDSNADADVKSLTEYYESGNLLTTEEMSQLQRSVADDLTASARVSYTEPLGGPRVLELRAERRVTYEDQNKSVFDRVGSELVFNDSLSLGYDRGYSYNMGRAVLSWDKEDSYFSIGGSIQQSNLDGEIIGFGVPIQRSYVHFLPTIQYRSDLGRGRSTYVRYSANTREPTIQQLQPVVDNTDPLNLYIGNPELQPEYRHSLFGYFRWFDQFTFMNVFTSLNASYAQNSIVRSRTVNERFGQEITSVNADGDWSVGGNVNFGTPIRPVGLTVNISNNASLGRSTEFVNSIENDTQTLRNSVRLRFENRNKELFDAGAGTSVTFNRNAYSLNQELNQSYVNRSWFADLVLTPDDYWRISTSIDLAYNSREVFGSSRNVTMWNAEISRSLMKENRAQIVLQARDLLNEGVDVDYTNSAGFVREEQVRALGRYFLLKFVYNLSPNSPGGRSIRIRG